MSDTGITKSLIDRVFTKVQDDQDHNYKVSEKAMFQKKFSCYAVDKVKKRR